MHSIVEPEKALSSSSAGVVIDWARVMMEADEQHLLSWVSAYPRRSDIHVYVGSVNERHMARKIRRLLLSLGCTVTSQYCFS